MKNKFTTIGDIAYVLLTQNQIAIIDKADLGLIGDYHWCANKGRNTFYALISHSIGNTQCTSYMHRIIMGLTDSKVHVDHKNHDGLDNRRSNLRFCTNTQNHMNMAIRKDASSKYKGVCWNTHAKKWKARAKHNYKEYHIGYFKNEIEAAKAYNKKAIELFGSFANINKIQEKL